MSAGRLQVAACCVSLYCLKIVPLTLQGTKAAPGVLPQALTMLFAVSADASTACHHASCTGIGKRQVWQGAVQHSVRLPHLAQCSLCRGCRTVLKTFTLP
jgi:hypothetical protein